MSIIDQTSEALDKVLRAQVENEEDRREKERAYRAAQTRDSGLGEEARRLRMALFALTGSAGNAGDANSANLDRRMELKREVSR